MSKHREDKSTKASVGQPDRQRDKGFRTADCFNLVEVL